MTQNEFFEKTDYSLLQKQKITLFKLLALADKLTGIEKEHLDGLINFIDNFQDTAIDNGMKEEKVYAE